MPHDKRQILADLNDLNAARFSWFSLLTFHWPRPVYEYPLNGQWIMMDIDDDYILSTRIWKGEYDVQT